MSCAHRRRALAAIAAAAPAIAFAHVDDSPVTAAWTAWELKADIVGGIVLVALLYAAGMWKLRAKERLSVPWRHTAFFAGLAAIFLALQSPLDALAEHSFFMHQLQHLLLQTVAPMLLMLAVPQATLGAGFPSSLRRAVVAPILGSGTVRGIFGFLALPWIAALLLVASLYVWHWPAYHDLALRDNAVHYAMHLTMLAAGLLFFSCIFDSRPAPLGARYGTRINVLWAAMTACMLLGAGLFLKDTALYAAYDEVGRLGHMSALDDERLGALIMWIPGSAVWVPAFFVLLRRWDAHELRLHERLKRGIAPVAAATAAANYRVALWIGLVAFTGFATTLAIGWISTGAPR